MLVLALIFWAALGVVLYAYAGYPLLIAFLARYRPALGSGAQDTVTSVSILIAARNEVHRIGARIAELSRQLASLRAEGIEGEIIVVSDGSTDGTAERARACGEAVRVIELEEPQGKSAALQAGARAAVGGVLVFADMRQRWAPDAVRQLLRAVVQPGVGAATGRLVLESAPGAVGGVGFYWRFESWLRRNEGRFRSCVGVTGAIAAVRKELFGPLPAGIVLDDVYWPMLVALRRQRVVYVPEAVAHDRLPDRPRDEFGRKVRTLAGNLQLVTRLPSLLVPWRNPLWWEFVSHKIARLVAAWALLAMLITSLLLAASGKPFYLAMAVLQLSCYAWAALAAAGIGANRLASAAAAFLMLNLAALAACFVWLTGNTGRSWRPVQYAAPRVA